MGKGKRLKKKSGMGKKSGRKKEGKKNIHITEGKNNNSNNKKCAKMK